MYRFTLAAIWPYLGQIPQATLRTVALTAAVLVVSLPIALAIALARRSGTAVLTWPALAWVELFRNIPVLVLVYACFFGLAEGGLHLSNMMAASVALTLNASAYLAEIFRAGLAAVAPGQTDASRALGLGRWATLRRVLLPQALRTTLPAIGNQVVGILLGSAAAAVIGVHELSDWMLATGASTFRYMETFLVAAVIYIALCQGAGALAARLGRGP